MIYGTLIAPPSSVTSQEVGVVRHLEKLAIATSHAELKHLVGSSHALPQYTGHGVTSLLALDKCISKDSVGYPDVFPPLIELIGL